jgi:short-subunit dehydrogenase
MHITKLSLNQMRSQSPQGGVILQISSVGGFIGFPGNAAYHASKFALEGLTEAISKELDPAWNIRFTIIEPGAVKTKWAEENMVTVKQHDAYVGKGLGADIMRDLRKVFDIGAEPEKVAGVLLHTAGMPKAPFRLPLGADAWTLVNQELEQVKSNLNEWRVMSESTSAEDARQVLKSIGLYKD